MQVGSRRGATGPAGPALPSCLSLFSLLRLFIERIRQTTQPCFGRVIVLALSAQMFSHNHPTQRSRAAEVNRLIPNNPAWRNGLLPSRTLNHIYAFHEGRQHHFTFLDWKGAARRSHFILVCPLSQPWRRNKTTKEKAKQDVLKLQLI